MATGWQKVNAPDNYEATKLDKFIYIISSIYLWFRYVANPFRYYRIKKDPKLVRLAKNLPNAVKAPYLTNSEFAEFKYELLYTIKDEPNILTLTEDKEKIYEMELSPRQYREFGIIKYILGLSSAKELATYLKMSVIASFNPKFGKEDQHDEYLRLFDLLAAGEILFAQDYASKMYEITIEDLKHKDCMLFEYCWHMVLRMLVLNNNSGVSQWLPFLAKHTNNMPACYELLPVIINNIMVKNNVTFKAVLLEFVDEHVKIFTKNRFGETPRGDVAFNLIDKYLFIWAIGLLNLARYHGMDVTIEHYLVPKELLIPITTNQKPE